jgi:hypothetical protein
MGSQHYGKRKESTDGRGAFGDSYGPTGLFL